MPCLLNLLQISRNDIPIYCSTFFFFLDLYYFNRSNQSRRIRIIKHFYFYTRGRFNIKRKHILSSKDSLNLYDLSSKGAPQIFYYSTFVQSIVLLIDVRTIVFSMEEKQKIRHNGWMKVRKHRAVYHDRTVLYRMKTSVGQGSV